VKIAVTGGSGFIGSHVVDKMVAAGHNVVVIDRVRPHRPDTTFVDVDVVDLASMLQAVEGCDHVFHLAAVSDVNHALQQPVYTVQINVLATANVLEAARRSAVGRVHLASTVWVYAGALAEGALTEDAPFYLPGAGHIYTSTKMAGEMIVHNYSELYGQPFTILRYGIPFGPRMRDELVIPRFVRTALAGEPITIYGNGSQFRNYVYVEDMADAHVAALSHKAENEVFNLEGTEPVSIVQLAEALQEIIGDVTVRFEPARAGDYLGRTVSAEKAERILGWRATTPFAEGLRRYVDWYTSRR